MSETLFDPLEDGRSAPPRLDPPRMKPLEDDGLPSPFGAAMPERLPPVERYEGNLATVKVSGDKRVAKPRQHYPRVVTLLENETGGMFWTCDSKKIGYGGVQISTDLLGFMDLQGVVDGRLIGVNVTSKEKVASHLRDYTNPVKTHGSGRVPVETLLRRFLACGGRFLILGYEKVGPRWTYHRTEVTPELLDGYVARKRGRKA